jgi:hypothetical protein
MKNIKSKADTTKNMPKSMPLDKTLIIREFETDVECTELAKLSKNVNSAKDKYGKKVFKWIVTTNPAGEQTALHHAKLYANYFKMTNNQKEMNDFKVYFDRAYKKAIESDDKRYKSFVPENRKTIHNNTVNNPDSITFGKPKKAQGGIKKVVIDISKDSDGNFKTSEKFARENSPKQLKEMEKTLKDYFFEVRELQAETKKKIDAKNKLQKAA